MDKSTILTMLDSARKYGWVLEPQAKEICRIGGLSVPRFIVAEKIEDCTPAAETLGFPLAAKVVSPEIVHKTEHQGVAVNINDLEKLRQVFTTFSRLPGFLGVLLEKMSTGVELILGAQNDPQFGPVVLLGIGGTSVEIYKDTTIAMAPLDKSDGEKMISGLKGRKLLEGYRGTPAVDREALVATIERFSRLSMALADHFASIDINPLFCSSEGCNVADARIILK
ncbi:MAG: acetate--CoA ligase family protein [Proteobacteria bacterium]|nr:acetate--CoA ligase family protein [Pseudomonadota bacterium]MBU1736945.1 acetate--CoA ligase family protein [Pseudomonadota bacterium]